MEEIHIDLETDKDDVRFIHLLEDVKNFVTFPFQYYKDKNYDHYVVDVTIDNQILSICPTKNLKMFKRDGTSEMFYGLMIPKPTIVGWHGLQLPVSPKSWVLKMKKALIVRRARDRQDITKMERIIEK